MRPFCPNFQLLIWKKTLAMAILWQWIIFVQTFIYRFEKPYRYWPLSLEGSLTRIHLVTLWQCSLALVDLVDWTHNFQSLRSSPQSSELTKCYKYFILSKLICIWSDPTKLSKRTKLDTILEKKYLGKKCFPWKKKSGRFTCFLIQVNAKETLHHLKIWGASSNMVGKICPLIKIG